MGVIVSVVFVFALIVLIHEWGHFFVARRRGVAVKAFSIGMPPTVFRFTYRDVEYRIGILPIGGYVQFISSEKEAEAHASFLESKGCAAVDVARVRDPNNWFERKDGLTQMAVAFSGPLSNLVSACLVMCVTLSMYGSPVPVDPPVVAEVQSETAVESGLQRGDLIVAANGVSIQTFSDLRSTLANTAAEFVSVEVMRGETRVLLDVPLQRGGFLGIGVVSQLETVSLFEAFGVSVGYIGGALFAYGQGLYELVTLKHSFLDGIAGPIGVVSLGTQMASAHLLVGLLNFFVMISIVLAFCNLLPLPVLDGGGFLFGLYKSVRKKDFPLVWQMRLKTVTMVALAVLIVVASYQDIARIVQGC